MHFCISCLQSADPFFSYISFMLTLSTYLLPHLRKDHRKLTKRVPHGSQNYPARKYVFPEPKTGKRKKVQGVYCTLSGFDVFFASDVFTSIPKVSTFLVSLFWGTTV